MKAFVSLVYKTCIYLFCYQFQSNYFGQLLYGILDGRQTKARMLIAKIKTQETNTTIKDSLHRVLL